MISLDGDTHMSPLSLNAALAGAGGAVEAARQVLTGESERVFVASRPPGHHAEPEQAMGFCLFSNAAIAAKYAISTHGLDRVAVVDFDVHHGNGTQAAFWSDSHCVFASSHQMPLYPGTGARSETGVGNIYNAPIDPGTDGKTITRIWQDYLLPKVAAMSPELIIISAGFDAHANDPLGGLNMQDNDFANITTMIRDLADQYADGRIVSILEGGYDLDGLRDSACAHLNALR
jgi:acetoin utilization deacetylase AcuC-like enzyme